MKIFETLGLVLIIVMTQIQASPLCLNQKQISNEECDNLCKLMKSAHCHCTKSISKYQEDHTMFEKCKADFMKRYL